MSDSPMTSLLRRANFLVSCAQPAQYPPDEGYEVAFVGRSNVGKSSAINALTQRKKLAYPSKTPGRTQLINFFELDAQRRLVDLPGYGYAKASAKQQALWAENIESYFSIRQALSGVLWLLDIRHDLQKGDQMMLNWLLSTDLPVHLLLTKADKLSRNQMNKRVFQLRQTLDISGAAFIQAQAFSAQTHLGTPELLQQLIFWFNLKN